MGDSRYTNIYRVIGEIAPKVIVEIGTYGGAVAKNMIYQAYYCNKTKHKIKYFGFDLFEQVSEELKNREFIGTMVPPTVDQVKERLKDVPADVVLSKGDTRETLKNIMLPLVDFIFIDGGHSRGTVESDWNNLQKFMHDKTVVIFDDYWTGLREDNGCRPLIDKLNRNKYDVRVLEPWDEWKKYGGVYKINMVEVKLK